MAVICKHGSAGAQRADRDHKISERKNFALAIQLPGQVLRGLPDTVVCRHMDEQIEKCRDMRFGFRANHPAQDFAPHHIATHDLCDLEGFGQLAHRVLAVANELDVNR